MSRGMVDGPVTTQEMYKLVGMSKELSTAFRCVYEQGDSRDTLEKLIQRDPSRTIISTVEVAGWLALIKQSIGMFFGRAQKTKDLGGSEAFPAFAKNVYHILSHAANAEPLNHNPADAKRTQADEPGEPSMTKPRYAFREEQSPHIGIFEHAMNMHTYASRLANGEERQEGETEATLRRNIVRHARRVAFYARNPEITNADRDKLISGAINVAESKGDAKTALAYYATIEKCTKKSEAIPASAPYLYGADFIGKTETIRRQLHSEVDTFIQESGFNKEKSDTYRDALKAEFSTVFSEHVYPSSLLEMYSQPRGRGR